MMPDANVVLIGTLFTFCAATLIFILENLIEDDPKKVHHLFRQLAANKTLTSYFD